ncbi:MAG: alpha/beta hydrolase [Clostridia bacterium]|nr:alpha/beta hydrolase [Clostridia bacterium]
MIEIITHPTFLWIVGSLLVFGLLFWIFVYFLASYLVYVKTLKRESKDKWCREVPSDLNENSKQMYRIGSEWESQNSQFKSDVQISRDGLNLYGEYFDFGFDRCVMILSGRTEGLRYGYYFAIPYHKNGWNVLVVDPRAHGHSDGVYNTVGFEEGLDDVEWIKFLREKKGVKTVIFHGICIGSAGGMYALTNDASRGCADAIIAEGLFPNFGESLKNHLIERKKPVFIFFDLVDMWMKKYTGHSMKKGPIDVIDKLNKPLLMLHSKEDKYSTPENAQRLFDKAGTPNKRLVWFEKGRHSMIRITDTQGYDQAIESFLKENFG